MTDRRAAEPPWLNPVRVDKLATPAPQPGQLRAGARRDAWIAGVMIAAAAIPGLVHHVNVASYVFSIVGALACGAGLVGLCLSRHTFVRDITGVAGIAFVGPAVVNLPLLIDAPGTYFLAFALAALLPLALLAAAMASTLRAQERRRIAWGAEWLARVQSRSAAEEAAMNGEAPASSNSVR